MSNRMASDSDIEAYLHQLNRKTQSLSRDKDEGSQSDSESVFVDKPSAAKDHTNHHNSVIDSLSDIRALSEKYGSKQPKRHTSNVSSEVTNKKGKDAVRKKTQNEIESEKGESLSSYGRTIAHNEKAMQWLKKPSSIPPFARESINDLERKEDSTKGYEDEKNVNSSLDEELAQNINEAHLSAFDEQSEESSDSDGDIIKLANVMTLDDIIGTLDSDSGTPRAKQASSSSAYSVAVDENVDEKCKGLEDDGSISEVNDSLHSTLQREQEKDPGDKILCKDTKSPLVSTYKTSSKDAKNLLLSGNDTVVDSPFYKKETKNDHKTKSNIQFTKSYGNFYSKNRDKNSLELKKNIKELTYKNRSSDEVSTMLTDEADVVESIAESVPSIKEEGDQHKEPVQIDEENITVRSPQTVGTHNVPQQLHSSKTQKIHYEETLNEISCSDIGKHKSHGPLKSTKAEKNEDSIKKGKKQRSSHVKKKVKESSSEDSSESETSSSEASESESCHVCRRRKKRKKVRHDRVYKKYEKTASLSRYIFTPLLYEGMHMVFPPSMVALEEVLRQQVGLTRQFVNCQQAMYQEYSAALSSSHRYTTMKQTEKYIKKKKKKPLSFEEAFEKVKKEMSIRERHKKEMSTREQHKKEISTRKRHNPRHTT